MQAKDIMTTQLITFTPDLSTEKAIEMLVNHRISGAPVVDDEGKVVGLLSEKDLLVSLDFLGQRHLKDTKVADVMIKDVITFPEDASVRDVYSELIRRNMKRVPIMRDKKLVGIISRHDILRHIHLSGEKNKS